MPVKFKGLDPYFRDVTLIRQRPSLPPRWYILIVVLPSSARLGHLWEGGQSSRYGLRAPATRL